MGRHLGTALAAPIRGFVRRRLGRLAGELRDAGFTSDSAGQAVGKSCLRILKDWDPAGAQEHSATAAAAGIDPVDLYLAVHLTDTRDRLLYDCPPDSDGCSALLVPGNRCVGAQPLFAQTWDLGAGDAAFVRAIHRAPDNGPACWTVTCTGCPCLLFLNAAGVCGGTTNLRTHGVADGVGYLSILHRMARTGSAIKAAAVVRDAPRMAAHTYWVADAKNAFLLAADATTCIRERLGEAPLVQTNHVRPELPLPGETRAPSSSSLRRLQRLRVLLDQDALITPERLRRMLASREDGCDSINRYPEDPADTATNACWIASPAHRRAAACRGPADRGVWVYLDPACNRPTPWNLPKKGRPHT